MRAQWVAWCIFAVLVSPHSELLSKRNAVLVDIFCVQENKRVGPQYLIEKPGLMSPLFSKRELVINAASYKGDYRRPASDVSRRVDNVIFFDLSAIIIRIGYTAIWSNENTAFCDGENLSAFFSQYVLIFISISYRFPFTPKTTVTFGVTKVAGVRPEFVNLK